MMVFVTMANLPYETICLMFLAGSEALLLGGEMTPPEAKYRFPEAERCLPKQKCASRKQNDSCKGLTTISIYWLFSAFTGNRLFSKIE